MIEVNQSYFYFLDNKILTRKESQPMSNEEIGYDPCVLMAGCVQAAATILAAESNSEKANDPEAVAKLAAMIRDEALLQM